MAIFPPDQRQAIQPNNPLFNTFPLNAVTAVDFEIQDLQASAGSGNQFELNRASGIVISPYHVLTAAHVVYSDDNFDDENNPIFRYLHTKIQVTTSANERNLGNNFQVGISQITNNTFDPYFFKDENGNDFRDTNDDNLDIALLRTNQTDPLLTEDRVIGLIAFVNPEDAVGLTAETAGYPADNVSAPIFNNSGRKSRDLVLAPGDSALGSITEITGERIFRTNQNVDVFGGQSGSGVWHSYEGEALRVLGVFNLGDIEAGPLNSNGGALITLDAYQQIIEQIETDLGTENAHLLPENLIIGSNREEDAVNPIVGTYRRERIIGQDRDDDIRGEGADDRIEGNNGEDFLDGGAGNDTVSGGQDNDELFGGGDQDILFGGGDNDEIFGGEGNDTLDGEQGNDILNGGLNDDLLFGGSGEDFLDGSLGNDQLFGGAENDRLFDDSGENELDGGTGVDQALFSGTLTDYDFGRIIYRPTDPTNPSIVAPVFSLLRWC